MDRGNVVEFRRIAPAPEEQGEQPVNLYGFVIPVAGVFCLGLWILAIWKVVDLINGTS